MSRNVDTVHDIHTCFNERRLDDLVVNLAPDCLFINQSGEVIHGPDGFKADVKGWADAFSDGQITDAQYYDAGDTVVAEYIGRGTNDGPFAEMQPTGNRVDQAFIEVYHFDAAGKITSCRGYCDTLTLMSKLGGAPAGIPAQGTTNLRSSERTRTTT